MPDDLRDFLRLALTPGIGGVFFRALVDHFGSASAALSATPAQVAEVSGFGPKRAADFVAARAAVDVEGEIQRAADRGVRIVPFGSPDYPVSLTYLAGPPPVLFVRGSLLPTDARAFAIVGSRRCSLYGQDQAERFGGALARAGFTVVSGLARGIDLQAHLGALKAGGRTIAVLGNGLSSIYPPEHAAHAESIAAAGAVVSEFPMDVGPTPENFPRRNRVIAGLSLGVLVVEAGLRSGALITASYAAEQGKDTFAIPGRIDSPFAQGSHRLIQQGAKLVQCLEDILEEYADLGIATPAGEGRDVPSPLAQPLDAQEEAILAVLDGDPLTGDEIARRAALPISAVAANLTILELKRLVQSVPGQRYARRTRAN
jgi:DNA processing protein